MRPVTARFLDAIIRSHTLAVTATVNGEPLDILDGTVTLDATAAIRGTLDLTVTGPIPTDPTSLLAPYGNEIIVSRGILYPDFTSELVKVGTFGIREADPDDTGASLTVKIAGQDRAAKQTDARFEDSYQIDEGTNLTTALAALLTDGDPTVDTSHFPATSLTAPLTTANAGDDRWALAQQIATAQGMLLYFDADGTPQLTPLLGQPPVADLFEGDGGVLLSASRAWTRVGTYNRAIATGEDTGSGVPPVRAVATDDNPASPTYYFGPYGHVPVFFSSQFITTTDQAQDAATGLLQRQLGTTQTINFGSLVNPALEPNDTVNIRRLRAGIDEVHVLDQVVIPLGPTNPMTGVTRAVVS